MQVESPQSAIPTASPSGANSEASPSVSGAFPTNKQLECLELMQSLTETRRCPPSLREIARFIGVSYNVAFERFQALRKKGWIDWVFNRRRTVRVLRPSPRRLAYHVLRRCLRCQARVVTHVARCPLCGSIAFGVCDE